MKPQWKQVPLGDVLRSAEREEPVDLLKEYRLLGVRLDGAGPFLREKINGAQTSAAKLFRVSAGDFIYSRLFASRGAFGLIGVDLDGCHVSSEFPCFVPIPGRADVRFVNYWFRLPTTLARVNEDCTGSTPLTRNRLKESSFVRLMIPLPSLEEQERIVARIEHSLSLTNQSRRLREDVGVDLASILAAAHQRISVEAPLRPLSEIAPLTRRPVAIDVSSNYPQVSVRSFGRGAFHKPPLQGSEITWQKPYLVRSGDILISNIKAWEGAIAVARPEDDGRVGSHRYLTFVPTPGVATSRYVCFHLLTPAGLHAVGDASPGSADRNRTLSARKLLKTLIPVPAYSAQLWFDQLCTRVDELKRLQADARVECDSLVPAILDRAFKGDL